MKRLYSECSQEEDPLQLLTPAEVAAQQEKVSMLVHSHANHAVGEQLADSASCAEQMSMFTSHCDVHIGITMYKAASHCT